MENMGESFGEVQIVDSSLFCIVNVSLYSHYSFSLVQEFLVSTMLGGMANFLPSSFYTAVEYESGKVASCDYPGHCRA